MSTANRKRTAKLTLSSVIVSFPESVVVELLLVWTRVTSMAKRCGREMETMDRRTNAAKMKKTAGTQNTRAILVVASDGWIWISLFWTTDGLRL